MAEDYIHRMACKVLYAQHKNATIKRGGSTISIVNDDSFVPIPKTAYVSRVVLDVEATNPKYQNLKKVVFDGYANVNGGDKICATIDTRTIDETRDGIQVKASKLEIISEDGQIRTSFE